MTDVLRGRGGISQLFQVAQVLTREVFGSWLLYESSSPDNFHLQLTLFLHHTDLDVTWEQQKREKTVGSYDRKMMTVRTVELKGADSCKVNMQSEEHRWQSLHTQKYMSRDLLLILMRAVYCILNISLDSLCHTILLHYIVFYTI